jgi:hypothetical protein
VRKAFLTLLLVAVLMSACSTPPRATPTIPTLARLPSVTPTITPTITPSPIPTDTAAPMLTPTLTDTPSDTPTATLSPTASSTPLKIQTWPFTASQLMPTLVPTVPITHGDATVTLASSQLVDLRGGPGFAYGPLQPLSTGTGVFLVGRSWDSQWYQVRLMSGQEGWIYAQYLVVWIDPSRVVVTFQEPTKPPTVRVGNFALGGHVMDLTGRAFGLARSAGMTWIKVQHRYFVGQNVDEVAQQIQAAHQNGFHVLIGLVGDQGQLGSNYDAYKNSYADFAAQVAALGADAIEIWNEPNIDREWPGWMIHGATYTQLLAASYTAIKARSPNTIVISAAPAPTGFFGVEGCGMGGCNDDIFLKQMAFAGAQNYLDCVGLHHNDGIVSPLQTSGDPRGNYPTYYLSGLISRVPPEFSAKPLCFTEVGYLSPEGYGSLPGTFGWAGGTTVTDQAQWLAQAVQVARSTGRVELMIVWNVDFTSYSSSDPMAGYAILRPGGSCPACDTLKAVMG